MRDACTLGVVRLLATTALLLCACSPRVLGLPSREAIARYVVTSPGEQHVCVVPYSRGQGVKKPYAWVYWEDRQRLVLWEKTDAAHERDAVVHAQRSLDLATQVAETEDGVGHDGHLVARAWVDDVLRDCKLFGIRYTLGGRAP